MNIIKIMLMVPVFAVLTGAVNAATYMAEEGVWTHLGFSCLRYEQGAIVAQSTLPYRTYETAEDAANDFCSFVDTDPVCGNSVSPSGYTGGSYLDTFRIGGLIPVQSAFTFTCASGWPAAAFFLAKKERGDDDCKNFTADPIDIRSGQNVQIAHDLTVDGFGGIEFARYYVDLNNNNAFMSTIGDWGNTFSRRLVVTDNSVVALRHDGSRYIFNKLGTNWLPYGERGGNGYHLVGSVGTGFKMWTPNGSVEDYSEKGVLTRTTDRYGVQAFLTYSSAGKLDTVVTTSGKSLTFGYGGSSAVTSVTDHAGRAWKYTYQFVPNSYQYTLSSVIYPDDTPADDSDNLRITYVYGDSRFPSHLTGIYDESGNEYVSWSYDDRGRAIGNERSGGADQVTLDFGNDGRTEVTDGLGTTRSYWHQNIAGQTRLTGVSQPGGSGCGAASSSVVYDEHGNVSSNVDFNGTTTNYEYDLTRNLETRRVEGVGRAVARTISTRWHDYWRLPVGIAQPKKITTWVYNGDENQYCAPPSAVIPRPDGGTQPIGVVCRIIEQATTDYAGANGFDATTTGAARVWAYTYDQYGRVLTEDGPRTDIADITTYAYYGLDDQDLNKRGNLFSVTDALGHVTLVTRYGPSGDPEEVVDPNGIISRLTYDARGRVTAVAVGSETTTYAYHPAGMLSRTTLPDGSYVAYTYDAAHRLTQLQDGDGNSIVYTLDAMGNRVQENVYDSEGRLARSHARAVDALNRLTEDIGASAGRLAMYRYDAVGNLKREDAPLGRISQRSYDALSRLASVADAQGGSTRLGYDGQDLPTRVTDANDRVTTYARNGFGEVAKEVSPDRGTILYSYDLAGNLKARTDARGKRVVYGYDALNRITLTSPGDGQHAYAWDDCANGIGRLCGISDPSGSTHYQYDDHGRVAVKTQAVGNVALAVSYGFDSEGNLATLTTPSGQVIGYTYANHRPIGVSLNGQPLVSSVTYEPFGGVSGWVWPDRRSVARSFDQDGRMTQNDSSPSSSVLLQWDAADRLEMVAASGDNKSYGYDALDRLIETRGDGLNQYFTYDAVGNRQSKSDEGGFTQYTYGSNDNRLVSEIGPISRAFQYDAAGNLTGDGTSTFVYDNIGLLTAVQRDGATVASYRYNALGQRVKKLGSATGGVRLFVYDEWGRLLGEYNWAGVLASEYVWLDDLLVAVLKQSASGVVSPRYVHVDHLGTPRSISAPWNGKVIWRWESSPFGETAPNEDPDGDGIQFSFNLRFPGQYYDVESGRHYNYHRTYDPEVGRYVEPDPIGLVGGINLYAYVGGNPVGYVDPLGLETCVLVTRMALGFADHAALYVSSGSDTGGAAIYDPSGSYARSLDPHNGDMITGSNADISKFADFYKKLDGTSTDKTCKNTTKEEERRLFERALELGGMSGPSCAKAVSTVLSRSPYYRSVTPGTLFPGDLFRDARKP